MRTLILCIVGASCIFMAAAVHGVINTENKMEYQLEEALSRAMMQTEREAADQNIRDREEMISILMQLMAAQMVQENLRTELTVAVCQCDYEKKTMEIEATARYDRPDKKRGSVSVRRRIMLAEKEQGGKGT